MDRFDVKACIFDAYGTLFDVHSAVALNEKRLGDMADAFSATWRQKQLEYTWLRSLMARYADFWQITQDSLDYTLSVFGVSDQALRQDLLEAYRNLESYPEVPEVLMQLQRHEISTAILSNGSVDMLETASRSCGIRELVDDIISVEEVALYKPDPRVYQLAVERLHLPRDAMAFQSSNAWDIAGAASFGYRTVWVNRFALEPERLPARADAELRDLAGLPALLGLTG